MGVHLHAAPTPVTELAQLRFDRALAELQQRDPRARVILDREDGLATGVDMNIPIELPPATRVLPESDRTATAATLFLDRFGPLFGLPGWHVLEPVTAAPLGRTMWITYRADLGSDQLTIAVCMDADVVRHVRVTR